MTTLTVELPDKLAESARDAGLLEKEAIETMVREALLHRSADELFDAADRLSACAGRPMTAEEIQQEVNAVRCQTRNRAAGS